MAEIKVSVVIPVYNSGKFLSQTLDSILTQTLSDIEVLCVDDGSLDSGPEILETYAKKDPRIRLFRLKNSGPGAADARNKGLEEARGKYLSFLDADDLFDPDLLKKAYERAEITGADAVLYDACSFDSDSGDFTDVGTYILYDKLPAKEIFQAFDYKDCFFQAESGAAWCGLYRRLFVLEHGLQFKAHHHTDDLYFTYTALLSAERITALPDKLLFYRDNNEFSQTATRMTDPLAAPAAWKELQAWMQENQCYDPFKVSFVNKALEYCRWYLEQSRDYHAFETLWKDLHGGSLETLWPEDVRREDFYEDSLFDWAQDIRNSDFPAFLFYRLQKTNDRLFAYDPRFGFPIDRVQKDDRVVLYGAGEVGRRYFMENLRCGYCRIVAWVDKHYEKAGFPVTSPDTLRNISFDKVLICASSDGAAESIERDLREAGVEETGIINQRTY